MSIDQKNNSGFAALVVVVVIGAAALTLSLSTALLGVRELELSTTADRGRSAKSWVVGCLDRALLSLRQNSATPSYQFTLDGRQCIITIINEDGWVRRVIARGIIGEYEQQLEALITTVPSSRSIIIDNYTI